MEFFKAEKTTVKQIKTKKVKVKAGDIQAHIKWIDEQMDEVQKERIRYREILKEMMHLDKSTNEKKYLELYDEAKLYEDADARYTMLQEQKEKEYGILKKYKDSKFFIPPKDLAVITGVFLLSLFMISLERENPKSLKLASFVLKLFPIKI